MFYVYVDRTVDDSRPFYVGKGTLRRTRTAKRNIVWQRIAAKHGWRREVVFGTRIESAAFDLERELIAQFDTFHGWGANLSEGGEGPSGYTHTDEARRKICEAQTGKKWGPCPALTGSRHPFYGKKHTTEANERNRQAHLGIKNKAAKLTPDQAVEIRKMYASGGWSHRSLARQFNVGRTAIRSILIGSTWFASLEERGTTSS